MQRDGRRILVLVLVLAMVMEWGSFPILPGQAMATPRDLEGRQPVALAGVGTQPDSCQLPADSAFVPAALRAHGSPEGPPGIGRVATLPHQQSSPALAPHHNPTPKAMAKPPTPVTAFGRLPLAFIENQGQVDAQARFFLRTGGQTLWITHEGIIFDLLRIKGGADQLKPDAVARTPWQNPDQPSSPRLRIPSPSMGEGQSGVSRGNVARERLVFAQDLVGANTSLRIEAQRAQPGTYNYFRGNDPAQWRTGVRGYAEVSYREVWEGIDLRLYGNGQALEQEFIVKPGADLSQIRIAYRGIEGLRVAEDGSLLIKTAFGELRESRPRIYQEIDGKRVAVDGRFKLMGETAYTFEVGPYQRQYALVIDPTLVYSTYLGGGGSFEYGQGIAVDRAGNAYVTGLTGSANFPTMVPFQGTFPSTYPWIIWTAFITKLNATGSALIYSTFLGSGTQGTGIAVDTNGAAYVTGWVGTNTGASVPLTTGAAETTPGFYESGFVTKLSPDGSQLEYSTYSAFGSSNVSKGIAIDPDGNAYITGDTAWRSQAWARKLNPTGTAYLYT